MTIFGATRECIRESNLSSSIWARRFFMKNADLYCFALSCLLIGWLMRRNRHQEIDPVMRLRMIGAL